jgi:hypothetical protein
VVKRSTSTYLALIKRGREAGILDVDPVRIPHGGKDIDEAATVRVG